MPNFLTRLFTRAESPDTPPASIMPPPRERASGDVLTIGAVFRALQILTTAASQLSVQSYKYGTPLDAQPSVIRKPSTRSTRSQWISEIVSSLATNGNAFLKIVRAPDGSVLDLTVLPPHKVRISNIDGQPLTYLYKDKTYRTDDIAHLKFLALPGEDRGLGPIEQARRELQGAMDLSAFAGEIFNRSDVPSGILKTDKDLKQDQAEAAKTRWAETHDGGVRVLSHGLSYDRVTLNADDAQYIETRRLTRTEIAGLFGVPVSLMAAAVEGSSMTYSNVESEWLGFVRFTLMAYLRPIEDVLTDLMPHGQTVRFNLDALLRPDTLTRYQAHKLGIEAGFVLIDEAREMENRPKLGGKHAAPALDEKEPA